MTTRPNAIPEWATEDTYPADAGPDAGLATKQTPPDARIEQGWRKDIRPAPQYQNYWQNKVGEWISYLANIQLANWNPLVMPVTAGGNVLLYDEVSTVYIMAGGTDYIATAYPDPLEAGDWDQQVPDVSRSIAISWGCTNPEGVTILGGDKNYLYRSDDGVTWTSITLPTTTGNTVTRGAVWDPIRNVFVLMRNTRVATSPDGITWTARAQAVTQASPTRPIAINSHGRIAILNEPTTQIIYSDDGGVSWTVVSTAAGEQYAITSSGAAFYVVGNNGTSYYSADGTVWVLHAQASFDFRDVAASGSAIVATMESTTFPYTGQQGIVYSTDNGATWSGVSLCSDADSFLFKGINFLRNSFHVIGHRSATSSAFRSLRLGTDTTDRMG